MNDLNDFEQKMHQKYPEMLQGLTMDMTKSCLAWGFECAEGWNDIIENMLEQLQIESNNQKEQVVIEQIKEKFGTLRVYHSGLYSDNVNQIVRRAELKSAETCEVCGKKGEVRGGGWIKTLCDEHANNE